MKEFLQSKWFNDYGTILILVILCLYFSMLTFREQFSTGADGGAQAAEAVDGEGAGRKALIIVGERPDDSQFAQAAKEKLEKRGFEVIGVIQGTPSDARQALIGLGKAEIDVIVATDKTSNWNLLTTDELSLLAEPDNSQDEPAEKSLDTKPPVITLLGEPRVTLKVGDAYEDAGAMAVDNEDGDLTEEIKTTGAEVDTAVPGNHVVRYNVRDSVGNAAREKLRTVSIQVASLGNPHLKDVQVFSPASYKWSTFFTRENLLKVANHIAVIAIIAIGMTMVIITAGIDLSVGSLVAFSAVLCAWCLRSFGGVDAGIFQMSFAGLAAIIGCTLFGATSGVMVTVFRIPAFIATLAFMMIASGLAFLISDTDPIRVEAVGFDLLGGGAGFLGIPNPVILMIVLYVGAHVLMTRTSLGRYIYAVGGNPEAARLSGVPVMGVLIFVYAVCGALAGVGGVIQASLFNSGDPKFGIGEELQVIAAVVVGGTSLAGGQGRIFGTLVGALIIAVIYSGMNQTGVTEHMQKVVYGVVILLAVLLDRLKKK